MKRVLVAAVLLAVAGFAKAQTASQAPAKPATHPAAATASGIKLPPGVPPARGILKTAFSLKYQDVKIGTGGLGEPNKIYKVHYTVWIAADGRKLDSSYDHPAMPVFDDSGKPVMDANGKQKQEAGQPYRFLQGVGRGTIPGVDEGVEGMRIGGKRRLFIPWQLAYGVRGRPTNDPKNPGVPPKADLIFDVELLAVADMPAMPARPMGAAPGGRPLPGAPGHPPTGPGQPTAPGQPAAPGQSAAPGQPPAPAQPAPPGASATPASPATAPAASPASPPASSTPAAPTPAPTAPTTTPQPK
jgi:peptidylprolyl isomerase